MQILDRRIALTTPWFNLVAKHTDAGPEPFYALRMLDYVTVLAVNARNELALVRQYRPAVERHTLELPGGHVEANEKPEASARRELAEECGLDAPELELLGTLLSDTGRNENRLWCYFARNVVPLENYSAEPGVELVLVPMARLRELMARGEFDHALNLAAITLAVARHGPELFALK